jgi:acid stress chaperone HdeB
MHLLKVVVLGAVLAVTSVSSPQAQVTINVSKITCAQYVQQKISSPNLIAAWLSGYYNAKRNNLLIEPEAMEENVTKVKNFCSDEKNFKVTVMKAVENILGKKK